MTARTRLAVLGSPISHSLSPALHRAAYDVLGLDWTYDAIEVTEAHLAGFIAGLDDGWRGLSLTMPLKRAALELPLVSVDPGARATGSANTLRLTDDGIIAANTDVLGIVEALRGAGTPRSVWILGAGATAASAVVAAAQIGATRLHLSARSPERAGRLRELGLQQGVTVDIGRLDEPVEDASEITISTLPGGSDTSSVPIPRTTIGRTLLDVAYDPWPSALGERWATAGGTVVSGLEMLIHQAVAQIRLFAAADSTRQLPEEARVISAMRAAVRGPLR